MRQQPGPAVVHAPIQYLGAMDTLPYFYAQHHERDNLVLETHTVAITEARGLERAPQLEQDGFQLVAHRSAIADFGDGERVGAVYTAEIAALIAALTGAEHVAVQGAVRRFSERERHPQLVNSLPARFVHIDYSAESFHAFASTHLAGHPRREALLAGRYAAYNIWRVLTPPPQDVPLAVCAAPSVAAQDRVTGEARIDPPEGAEIRFGSSLIRASINHRWYWYRDMHRDEALVFKAWDSDAARTQGCPHTAFDDPGAGPAAVPRASVEIRAYAYWGS